MGMGGGKSNQAMHARFRAWEMIRSMTNSSPLLPIIHQPAHLALNSLKCHTPSLLQRFRV